MKRFEARECVGVRDAEKVRDVKGWRDGKEKTDGWWRGGLLGEGKGERGEAGGIRGGGGAEWRDRFGKWLLYLNVK